MLRRFSAAALSLFLMVGAAFAAIHNESNSYKFEHKAGLFIDKIGESTEGHGVIIEGVRIKDGGLSSNAGTKGGAVQITVVEEGVGSAYQSTIITLASYPMTITDAGAAGAHGSVALYTFPEGVLAIHGAAANLTATCGTDGLTATATNEIGLGTATAGVDNAALTGTEEDIITGSASDLVASAEALAAVNSTGLTVDGHTTAGKVWLNFVFAADDATDNDVCTISGTVRLPWIWYGDY